MVRQLTFQGCTWLAVIRIFHPSAQKYGSPVVLLTAGSALSRLVNVNHLVEHVECM